MQTMTAPLTLASLDVAIQSIVDELRTEPLAVGERIERLAERGRLAAQRRAILAEMN